MSFPVVSLPVSSKCSACGAKVNPRWPTCIACGHSLRNQPETNASDQPQPGPETPQAPPRDVDAILGMPLTDFGRCHLALRVKLPDGSMCWFCSGTDEVATLRGEGIDRGAIWTARELVSVIGDGGTRETIARLIAVKREFGGILQLTNDIATRTGDDGQAA